MYTQLSTTKFHINKNLYLTSGWEINQENKQQIIAAEVNYKKFSLLQLLSLNSLYTSGMNTMW